MIEHIVLTTFLVSFFLSIFDKFYIWGFFEKLASVMRFKFLYKLFSCRYCITFHLTWMTYLVIVVFEYLNITQVFIPFFVFGLLNIVKK